MASKVFGFVGVESYDIAYYAARTALKLGHSVLLVDGTVDHSVSCIYNGDINGDIVDVSGVHILASDPTPGVFKGYEYVFVVTGFKTKILGMCDEIYMFTTLQKNHIKQLQQIEVPDVPRFLVIRDRAACPISTKGILEDLKQFDFMEEEVYELEDSDGDIESKVMLHYNAHVKVSRLSASVLTFVRHLFDTDATKKEIDRVWRSLQKG